MLQFHVPFWIQVFDLPFGFMSKGLGKQLGNYVGSFSEHDDTNNMTILEDVYVHLCYAGCLHTTETCVMLWGGWWIVA